MKKKWWSIVLACAFALTLAQATGFSASALAAPKTHTAVASPSVGDPPYPYQPKCSAANDGATWTSPAGIRYQCRYVSGVGYQWVPIVGGSCPGAEQGAHAVKPSYVVC